MSATSNSNPSVGLASPHESAHMHVTGEARYTDDIPEPRHLLHTYIRYSERAHARLTKFELDAVRQAPGVAEVISAADMQATTNDIGEGFPGSLVFAEDEVQFHGQPLFAVAAESLEQARSAAMLATVEYEDLPAILTIEQALEAGAEVNDRKEWTRGDPQAALEAAPHRITGSVHTGGQEHFYLEGQNSVAVPNEDGQMLVHCSTQGPTEVQHAVSKVLGVPNNAVTVETRRMGGGFGGKETQGAWFAAMAAVLAQRTSRPVKVRLDRDDDMTITGKRHPTYIQYDVGFDDDGRILGMDLLQAADGGYYPDLTGPVADRALWHADNAYFIEHAHIISHRCRTHKQPNTAFRGFGGPQGIVGIENIMEDIARHIGRDPLDVRKVNFYGIDERNMTPYGQVIEDNILHDLVPQLEQESDYARRRQAVREYNASHTYLKKGLALTPVKFGISFGNPWQNQGGALVHIYTDGTVQINHGGTEMGQGLHTKVNQVVAEALGIDLDQIRITATVTDKVPNTMPTSASTGTDLNAAAAYNAVKRILDRVRPLVRDHYDVGTNENIEFRDNAVHAGERRLCSFVEVVNLAFMNRVQLSSTGFYATPRLHVDEKGWGRPFHYFAYGAAVAEVLLDTLTGEYRMTQVDILHDVGRSINPGIDMGQIEGGFLQGAGWLTTEELYWDDAGRIRTFAPSTYKIPACSDLPSRFNAKFYERSDKIEAAIHRSKAVGEPPLMHGIAVLHAIKDAVAATVDYRRSAPLDAPATPEAVLRALDAIRDDTPRHDPASATPATRATETVVSK